MTTHTEAAPLLFGRPYGIEQQDCALKLERLATLAATEQTSDADTGSLTTEPDLLTGCCDAFSLIKRELFDPRRIVREVNKHLLQLLLAETSRRMEAIGFTAGMMFSNETVPAKTDAEAHASMTQCLGDACKTCLTLEQQFERVAAQYRDRSLEQEFARVAASSQQTRSAPTPEETAALSLSRSKGRQNAS